tara:strand:+ start:345 stop:620 length:276 start_codon:yes stop_codon:yes gene_type:complete
MACNSSGVKTADAVISSDRCKLVSIHASGFSSTGTIKLFDNASAASGKEIVRISFDASKQTAIEYDMHGAIANNGLYLDITGTAAVSVEFA